MLRALGKLWSLFGHLAAHRRLMVATSGLLTLLACLGINALQDHDPVPEVADESAYLLAGDTFSKGRLTNPPHPLWRSLETFHILQQPTYQAKYPPGQGLFLALGNLLTGRPCIGLWISASLLISALCWMLQGWFPPRWAVIGTLTAAATIVIGGAPLVGGTPGYWIQTYWGGAAAALGGALLLGGLRRTVQLPRLTASAAMGAGAIILALTRPFEGLLLCMPAAALLIGWLLVCRASTPKHKLLYAIAPAACVLAAGLSWILYYNWRVTGDALRMPYMVYREQYQSLPIFLWQQVREVPAGLNHEMLAYTKLELAAGHMLSQPLRRTADYYRTLSFEAGPILAPVFLLLLPWTARHRWIGFAAAACVFVLLGMCLGTYFEVHYHAPAAPLTIILLTAALRRIVLLRRRRVFRIAALFLVLCTFLNTGREWYNFTHVPRRLLQHWAESHYEVTETLTRKGGTHVVFVRYGPRHTPHAELVYNGADIDNAPVVWVRFLDPEQNSKVLNYFQDRTAWIMNVEDDMDYAKMTPWPATPK